LKSININFNNISVNLVIDDEFMESLPNGILKNQVEKCLREGITDLVFYYTPLFPIFSNMRNDFVNNKIKLITKENK